MNEWKEAVWLAISAFITAMLITFTVVMGSEVRQVSRKQQDESNAVAVMQEYRKWVRYENVIVNQGDVINCILENRSKVPSVVLSTSTPPDDASGSISYDYMWNGEVANAYSIDFINTQIKPGTYIANIVKDKSGAVFYIWFRRKT